MQANQTDVENAIYGPTKQASYQYNQSGFSSSICVYKLDEDDTGTQSATAAMVCDPQGCIREGTFVQLNNWKRMLMPGAIDEVEKFITYHAHIPDNYKSSTTIQVYQDAEERFLTKGQTLEFDEKTVWDKTYKVEVKLNARSGEGQRHLPAGHQAASVASLKCSPFQMMEKQMETIKDYFVKENMRKIANIATAVPSSFPLAYRGQIRSSILGVFCAPDHAGGPSKQIEGDVYVFDEPMCSLHTWLMDSGAPQLGPERPSCTAEAVLVDVGGGSTCIVPVSMTWTLDPSGENTENEIIVRAHCAKPHTIHVRSHPPSMYEICRGV